MEWNNQGYNHSGFEPFVEVFNSDGWIVWQQLLAFHWMRVGVELS